MGFLRVRYLVLIFSFINSLFFLKKIISDKSNPVLLAEDTSFVITNSNSLAFRNINEDFRVINEQFQRNLLSLNYNKTFFALFVTETY
jgi:hypothetical protein